MIKNMTKGTPVRLILGFALPMLVGNIFQQVYNIADAAIVGRFVSAEALAAVGASGSTTFFLISFLMGLTNGASIIMSQCFGCGMYDEMKKSVTGLAYILAVFSVLITILGIAITNPILHLLNTPSGIFEDAATYLRIQFTGVIGIAVYNGCAALLRSLGDSKTPLYMLIIASITNVVLDLVFIVNLNMGVAGAALATVVSQVLSAGLCIVYIAKYKKKLSIENLPTRPEKRMVIKIFRLGIPTALQSSLIALGGMSVQSLVNSFGAQTMAAYTAASKIDSMAIQPIVSVATALSVFTGQNVGIGNLERIKTGLRQTLCVMLGICVTIAVLIVIFRTGLLTLFLKGADKSIEIGATYIAIIGIAYVIAGVMQTYLNVIRGAGDVNFSMIAGIVELGTRILFAYLLAYIMKSETGIWIATPLSWGMACSITVMRYYSGKWKTKKVI